MYDMTNINNTTQENNITWHNKQWTFFLSRYHLAWLACTMTMQRICFALPLTLSTPSAVILIVSNRCDNTYISFLKCSQDTPIWLYIALISVALWLGQFFATTYYAWKNQDFIMANEAMLFWIPSYEGECKVFDAYYRGCNDNEMMWMMLR